MGAPPSLRSTVATPLLILVACLATGCAQVTVFVATGKPGSTTVVATNSPPPSATARFHSASGRFSVDIPGTFTETVQTANNPNLGPIEVHYFTVTPDGGPRYAVTYGDFPSAYVQGTSLATIYREARAGDVGAAHGRLVEAGTLTIAGHPADTHTVDGETGFQRFVTVLVGNRAYSLAIRGTEAQVRSAEATRFIASFGVDPK
jgi:hypothetical protein